MTDSDSTSPNTSSLNALSPRLSSTEAREVLPGLAPGPFAVPSGGVVSGDAYPPPSKSITHRYAVLALLAAVRGESGPWTLEHPLLAEDTHLTLKALEACGMTVEVQTGAIATARLTPPEGGFGASPKVVSEVDGERVTKVHCGNAGTLCRILTAVLTAVPGRFVLDGSERLRERPVGALLDALAPLGARVRCLEAEGYLPLLIEGESLEGGITEIDAGESSQYVTALLLAGLAARRSSRIRVQALTSAPYLDITLAAIARCGGVARWEGDEVVVEPGLAPPRRLPVEADFSAVAYPAAAAALTGGRLRIHGVNPRSPQGDRRFLEVLERMGATVRWSAGSSPAEATAEGSDGAGFGEGIVEVVGGPLRGVTEDFSDVPDQVPTLAALAPFAAGVTRIENVAHLRIKESDRLAAMATELGRLGATVEERADGLVIPGSWSSGPPPTPRPEEVETYDDHRIAMSLALVGLRRPGTRILEPRVVAKSYPTFWRDLRRWLEP